MKQLLNAITCNEPKRLIKPVFWNALANLSNLLPFLCLAYIVSQIYEYFVSGTLNRTSLWVAWGVMLACFVVTWIFENIACKLTYRDGFMASADGRIKLAEHIRRLPLGFLMSKNSSEIGNTMMNDFSRTESAMTHILPQIISGAIMAVIASVVLLIADWRMGLAMFAGFPIALLDNVWDAGIGAPVGHAAFTGKGQPSRKAARISVWDAYYQILQYAG